MRYIPPKTLFPEKYSSALYIRILPSDLALFRFLLEAYENLAMFTTLEPKTAIVKLIFSPNAKAEIYTSLNHIQQSVHFDFLN